jgi:hypothetical protein
MSHHSASRRRNWRAHIASAFIRQIPVKRIKLGIGLITRIIREVCMGVNKNRQACPHGRRVTANYNRLHCEPMSDDWKAEITRQDLDEWASKFDGKE